MSAIVVVDPGALATLQDLGRTGYQRFGVAQCGAMDECSLRIANLLVGNDEGEAAVEFTLSGGTWEIDADACRIAVAGGEFPVTIDGRHAAAYCSHTLRRGQRVVIGRAAAGARGYIAVAGGFDVPSVLGSRSTHVRSGLGGLDGAPLKAGSRLPLRAADTFDGPDVWLTADLWPGLHETVRVVLGPQDDLFSDAGKETFLTYPYRVLPQSDRMGYRLEGPPIAHAGDYNIVSDGIARGSVQVVGNGQPIVLLADRQTTGGYAKIATVISADLPVLAQRRPGDTIRFEVVMLEEAEEERALMMGMIDGLKELFRPVGSPEHETRHLLEINIIDGVVGVQD